MGKSKAKEKIRKKYSQEDLKNALAAVKSGRSIRGVSLQYGIPRVTLDYKSKGKRPINKNSGPPTVLSSEEEKRLVSWMIHVSKMGFPVTRSQLVNSVEQLVKTLKRDNPFKNDRPGRKWYEGFLARHPELSQRIPQNLSKSRGAITENVLRRWFSEVKQHLDENALADVDGSRIFNCDESAFFLNPKGEKVIVKKGDKAVYTLINGDEKECLTTLIMANANGTLAPPMVVFAYERIPARIISSIPQSWGVGKTENGWMTGESFYEYIANVFDPWLTENNIERPIVLYVDGHTSHLTMSLSDFCTTHGITLVALYPNATHILQPLDVAFFRPLKGAWRQSTLQWRIDNDGQRMTREKFAPLLEQTLQKINVAQIISSGFRGCGLYPFSADAVNYAKLIGRTTCVNTEDSNKPEHEVENVGNVLRELERSIDSEILESFKDAEDPENWSGDPKHESLFVVWNRVRRQSSENPARIEDSNHSIPHVSEIEGRLMDIDIETLHSVVDHAPPAENDPAVDSNYNDNLMPLRDIDFSNDSYIINDDLTIQIFGGSSIEATGTECFDELTALSNTDFGLVKNSSKYTAEETTRTEPLTMAEPECHQSNLLVVALPLVPKDDQNEIFQEGSLLYSRSSVGAEDSVIYSVEPTGERMETSNDSATCCERSKDYENERFKSSKNVTDVEPTSGTSGVDKNRTSSFDSALFWPDPLKIQKKKRNSTKANEEKETSCERVPSVVTSKAWRNWQHAKLEKKQKEKEELENRKKQRQEAAAQKRIDVAEKKERRLREQEEKRKEKAKIAEEKMKKKMQEKAERQKANEKVANKKKQKRGDENVKTLEKDEAIHSNTETVENEPKSI